MNSGGNKKLPLRWGNLLKKPFYSSNSIADCVNQPPNQIKLPSRRKRSQYNKRQPADICPAQQLLQIKPGTDQKAIPPSGSDEKRGPWPAFGDNGDDIEKRIYLLMLTQGVDGVANPGVCWQDTYMQIPVCAPLQASRQSPAKVVEPCRLCKRYFLPSLQAFWWLKSTSFHMLAQNNGRSMYREQVSLTTGNKSY